ncbi:MAG: hypothetical protein P8I99_11525 [Acidimicrobiales bacterium]|nr:hypothetical protein [Acidimicrobiales bacterium]MDG1878025.1 hypothetical protein [Acidimicrobiales bacterium]
MVAKKRPLVIVALLLCLGVFAASCGDSSDPETWAEAGDDGVLRANFIRACTEANEEGGDLEFDGVQAAAYCECAFVEIVEIFGGEFGEGMIVDVAEAVEGQDFQAFKDYESGLRSDPEDIPAEVEAVLNGCVSQAAP